jgi:hypothetical protein
MIKEQEVYVNTKPGDRFINFRGDELRIMAEAEGYFMARFKGCIPFVMLKKDLSKFISEINGKRFPQTKSK